MKLIILFFFISFKSLAQLPDRFNFYYQQLGDSNRVSTSGFGGEANHQLFIGETNIFNVGVSFSQTRLENRYAEGSFQTRDLQSFVPSLTLLRSIDSQHNLLVLLRPGLYGDGSGSASDDFRFEGGVVMNKVMSSKLTLGLGMARGTNFGRDLVVPLLQIMYTPSSQFYLTGLLPVRAGFWYVKSSELELGAIFRLEGSVYNINDNEVTGASQLGFAAAQLGAAAKYKVFSNNFVIGELGVTALRRYEWQKDQGPTMNLRREPLTEKELSRVPYVRIAWQQSF